MWGIKSAVLTVIAVRPRVGRHGAVTGEVLPLLDAHAHVGAGVLLAGRTGTCVKVGDRRRHGRAALPAPPTHRFMQNKGATGEGNNAKSRSPTWNGDRTPLLISYIITFSEVFLYSAGEASEELDSTGAAAMALSPTLHQVQMCAGRRMHAFFFFFCLFHSKK